MKLLLTALPSGDGSKLCEDFMENIEVKDQPEPALISNFLTASECTIYPLRQNVKIA